MASDGPQWRQWWALTKPRLTLLVIGTALAGYALAPAGLPGRSKFWPFAVSVYLLAASAAILNMWMERDVDALMKRTRERPLPAGRLTERQVFWAGQGLTFISLLALALATNWLTAALGLLTWISYLLVYTPMKRKSSLAILAGAVPGALPPVMGWTAAGGSIDPTAIALFLLMFVWQVPHFLAIAALYGDDYENAGLKVLGREAGTAAAGRQMVLYAMLMLPITLWCYKLGIAGPRYAVAATLLSLLFIAFALRAALRPGRSSARALLLASVTYLPLLFAAMLVDKQG
jgi:protoheme IX farnesyltransferase